MTALPNSTCPICNGANECAPARTANLAAPCWCAAVSIGDAVMLRVPECARYRSCLCPTCAGVTAGALATAAGDLT